LQPEEEETEPGGIIFPDLDLSPFLPESLKLDSLEQTDPRLARDPSAIRMLEESLLRIPTSHYLVHGDARKMSLSYFRKCASRTDFAALLDTEKI
jgi:hypothetical protein